VPKFLYTLKDERGRDYQGSVDAKNRKEAEAKLSTPGYYLTSLKKETQLNISITAKKITKMDIIVFARQFATMVNAGLPIVKSLSALSEQSDNDTLRKVLNDIRSKVESGFTLSEAMSKHPTVFSELFISMVRTGETGGILDKMLRRVSNYLEKEEDLRRKIKSAFAYPIIVSCVAAIVVAYLIIVVVPVFQSVYKSMKVDLPGPTLTLVAMSQIIRGWWLPLSIIGTAAIAAFLKFRKKEKVAFLIDKLKISIPLFGPLNRKVAVSRFVRSFGSLITSGIPIATALSVTESITANRVIAKVIDRIRMAVNRGENISGSLKFGKIFPAVVIQLVSAGEESGALDDMLDKSADFLDEEIDTTIKKLTVKLEPIMTISLALIVGFIALAIYLPMFDVIRHISD